MGILEAAKTRIQLISSTREEIEADRRAVAHLRQAGADLTRRREVRHYLSLPTLLAALGIAEHLEQEGFTAEIIFEPGFEDQRFLIRASHDLVVTLYAMTESRERLTALAKACSGTYDGWEGTVAP